MLRWYYYMPGLSKHPVTRAVIVDLASHNVLLENWILRRVQVQMPRLSRQFLPVACLQAILYQYNIHLLAHSKTLIKIVACNGIK